MGVVESGSGRAGRDAEGLGDLGGLQAQVMAQDEDRALLRREPPERALEQITARHGLRVVPGERLRRDIQGDHVDRRATRRTGEIETDADQDPGRPRLEPLRIAKAGQLAPGNDQGLLDRVVGEIDVPEDPSRGPEQPVGMGAHEDGEGVPITALSQFHEVAIHPGHRWCAPDVSASTRPEGGRRPSVQS